MPVAAPPDDVVAQVIGPSATVVRRIEIYEQDGITPWFPFDGYPRLVDGNIACSSGDDVRRTLDLTLENTDGYLRIEPGAFWYDKIIKIYRGVVIPQSTSSSTYGSNNYGAGLYGGSQSTDTLWESQVGEFMIDRLDSESFPHDVKVTGRDYAKKMLLSKFVQATTFKQGLVLETVVKSIAANAGIVKMLIPTTGITLGTDFSFDRGTERWTAANQLAKNYGYELFFDATGTLVMREIQDPVLSASAFTFQTGPNVGNLVSIKRSVDDSELYNHVLVTGESSDSTVPPVWAEAFNTEPSSPTNVAEIGDRLYQYSSSFITTVAQAQDVAYKFLKVHALEAYNLNIDFIPIWWLEPGDIVTILDPDASSVDPNRYLLTDFSIPLGLDAMSGTAKRVTIVTDDGTDQPTQTGTSAGRFAVTVWGGNSAQQGTGTWGGDQTDQGGVF